MSVSASFKTYVMEQLGGAGRLSARAMFGGVGLYWEGAFFALIDDDTLFLKVDEVTRPSFSELGARPFDPYKNGQPMEGYYEAPAEILEDRARLAEWRERAVEAAIRAKRRRTKGPKPPPGKKRNRPPRST